MKIGGDAAALYRLLGKFGWINGRAPIIQDLEKVFLAKGFVCWPRAVMGEFYSHVGVVSSNELLALAIA